MAKIVTPPPDGQAADNTARCSGPESGSPAVEREADTLRAITKREGIGLYYRVTRCTGPSGPLHLTAWFFWPKAKEYPKENDHLVPGSGRANLSGV
jgi:hypothetical protein